MKKVCKLCVVVVMLASALILCLPTGEERKIYDMTLRLHVLANSDDQKDQENKLAVRDRVLELLSDRLAACENVAQAEQIVVDQRDAIVQACRQELARLGAEDEVSLVLDREYYPTRHYEDISLPAGNYLSLRICIGQAEGQNWWCVLYPPVCLEACTSKKTLSQAGFSDSQIHLVTNEGGVRYKIKFKILQTVSSWMDALSSKKSS